MALTAAKWNLPVSIPVTGASAWTAPRITITPESHAAQACQPLPGHATRFQGIEAMAVFRVPRFDRSSRKLTAAMPHASIRQETQVTWRVTARAKIAKVSAPRESVVENANRSTARSVRRPRPRMIRSPNDQKMSRSSAKPGTATNPPP
jgi:hypothetical protein